MERIPKLFLPFKVICKFAKAFLESTNRTNKKNGFLLTKSIYQKGFVSNVEEMVKNLGNLSPELSQDILNALEGV